VVNEGAYGYWEYDGISYETRSNAVTQAGTTYLPAIERND
jgi:hypothetical protein